MRFTKMHGAGNDYVLLDARDKEADWPALAKCLCERHMGVGADGLLLVMPSDSADVRMVMYNPNGSEAEMCGNGIRCLAKYVLERDIVDRNKSFLTIETMTGILGLEPIWHDGKVDHARVAMGEPELRSGMVPVALSEDVAGGLVMDYPLDLDGTALSLTFVSMGNPHAIAFIESPVNKFPLHVIGPEVERHRIFPNRVNFSIVNAKAGRRVVARTWERGVGETLACGTGACAIAVASRLHGYTGDDVDITLPGGVLTVTWDGVGQVYLEGPTVEVFEGEWND
ncbi:MAG: diaminopimelate epimerase [Dehalococcoidia bacterium]|jgi:diaminopimelate epimerase|nr:diaminopimelate epimerase [Dehalococcoidia bacterium]